MLKIAKFANIKGVIHPLALDRTSMSELTFENVYFTHSANFAVPAEIIKIDNVNLDNLEIHDFEKAADIVPSAAENFPIESKLTNDNVMTLDAALLIAQSLHIVLRAENGKLVLWCPGVVVPRDVMRVLRANTGEVLRLIGLAHVSVCPSPERHYHSWQYTVKRDCCTICARLDYWMNKCA